MPDTDILIAGGGLAGLALADHLARAGRDYLLIEARPRLGGRILTEMVDGSAFDLGPAWFWPGQPRMAALVARLGLRVFEQYATGILCSEDETGRVHRGQGFASMQGSYRLVGGMDGLVSGLSASLDPARVALSAALTDVSRSEAGITAKVETRTGPQTITAAHVVLGLPPRVIASDLRFDPGLSDPTMASLSGIATWMAGQAKAIAVYDTPFWREDGLSGDAMSRRGPLVEIHDASPLEGGPYALFGFLGVPPPARQDQVLLKAHVVAQLARIFGPKADAPREVLIKDWALDARTATPLDHAPVYAHPHYGLPRVLEDLWEGKLHFGATEVAPQFGGYLEGALEAAENTLNRLGAEK